MGDKLNYEYVDVYKIKSRSINYPGHIERTGEYTHNIHYYEDHYYAIFCAACLSPTYYGLTPEAEAKIEIWVGDKDSLDTWWTCNLESFALPSTDDLDRFMLRSSMDKNGTLYLLCGILSSNILYLLQGTYTSVSFSFSAPQEISVDRLQSFDIISSEEGYHIIVADSSTVRYIGVAGNTVLGSASSYGTGVAIDIDHSGDGTTLKSSGVHCAWCNATATDLNIYYQMVGGTSSGSKTLAGFDYYNYWLTDFNGVYNGTSFVASIMSEKSDYSYTSAKILEFTSDGACNEEIILDIEEEAFAEKTYIFRLQISHKNATMFPLANIYYVNDEHVVCETQHVVDGKFKSGVYNTTSWYLDKPLTGSYYGDPLIPELINIEITSYAKYCPGRYLFGVGETAVGGGAD